MPRWLACESSQYDGDGIDNVVNTYNFHALKSIKWFSQRKNQPQSSCI